MRALPDSPGLRLERDCEVVGAHALPDPVDEGLFAAWTDQVELPDWSGSAVIPVTRVRVAVIDGGYGDADDGVPPETVPHPEAVSSVIRAVACPALGSSAICAAFVPNYTALRYVRRGVTGELGGFFGTQAELAVAMAEAVDDWRLTPAAQRPLRLILNLSLGWDEQYNLSEARRLPALAAAWATHDAACEGVLIIAAAGNRATDADSGPLSPAAWEQRALECPGDRGRSKRPTLYAVGALDGRDAPLALARPQGTPRIVAPGASVVVPLDTQAANGEATVTLSGTSMSAAAVSGTAALIWSLRPGLDAHDVMRIIYQSGEPLGRAAEFGWSPAEQRRLSVARAFAEACPLGVAVGHCPTAANRPILPAPRAAGVDATPDLGLFSLLFDNAIPQAIDPNAQPADALSNYLSPYVVPQPGSPSCPVCGFWGSKLYGQLDPDLIGADLGTAYVWVKTANGVSAIKLGVLPDTEPFLFELGAELLGQTPYSAWLEVPITEFGKTTITSSDLFIY